MFDLQRLAEQLHGSTPAPLLQGLVALEDRLKRLTEALETAAQRFSEVPRPKTPPEVFFLAARALSVPAGQQATVEVIKSRYLVVLCDAQAPFGLALSANAPRADFRTTGRYLRVPNPGVERVTLFNFDTAARTFTLSCTNDPQAVEAA